MQGNKYPGPGYMLSKPSQYRGNDLEGRKSVKQKSLLVFTRRLLKGIKNYF